MASKSDFYRILDLKPTPGHTIPTTELKRAYKQALLFYHPDKQAPSYKQPKDEKTLVPTVDEITEAYKTLADPKLKNEYDLQLQNEGVQQENTRHTGMETIDLEDLDLDESSGIWRRPCRCGSQPAFVVTETELEKNEEFGELITGCKGCSLWLKVLFGVAD